jgi:hypothetical protein
MFLGGLDFFPFPQITKSKEILYPAAANYN